jgi:hypothetical protein
MHSSAKTTVRASEGFPAALRFIAVDSGNLRHRQDWRLLQYRLPRVLMSEIHEGSLPTWNLSIPQVTQMQAS